MERLSGMITWEEIERVCAYHNIIVYGLGKRASDLFERLGTQYAIVGVIDNDRSKQGMRVDELLPETFQTSGGSVIVSSPSVLLKYKPDDTGILVVSGRYFCDIKRELESKGFYQIYDMYSCDELLSENDFATQLKKKEAYIRRCLEMEIYAKKIVFNAFADYADHGKYISEAMHVKHSDWELVWLVDSLDSKLPDYVRKVRKSDWKKVIYEMETAKVWVSDLPISGDIVKREGQIYIQTKHWASITLKRFYLDAATFNSMQEKRSVWKRESEIIDYIVVGSWFDRESCRRGFAFDREFIMAGSPRSDGLFRAQENKKKVYSCYGIPKNVHVLMFAPTYRFSRESGKTVHQSREIDFAYYAVKDALGKRFGGEWMIALRLHPSVAQAAREMVLPDFVFDVSTYMDSEELVSAFDIVVSDYSSIMFEPAFIRKPVLLYAPDLADYLKNEYDLLLDYRKLPFDMAETMEELCGNIMKFDKDAYVKQVDAFLDRYGVHEDGHASERVVDFISGFLR